MDGGLLGGPTVRSWPRHSLDVRLLSLDAQKDSFKPVPVQRVQDDLEVGFRMTLGCLPFLGVDPRTSLGAAFFFLGPLQNLGSSGEDVAVPMAEAWLQTCPFMSTARKSHCNCFTVPVTMPRSCWCSTSLASGWHDGDAVVA